MPPKRKAKPTAAATAAPDTEDFSKLKVADLRDECEQRGLETSGKKTELVERLVDYEESQSNGNGTAKKVKKEDGAEDFSKLKVADLRDECEQRGLETSGRKTELVERLVDYEESESNGNGTAKKVKKEDEDEVKTEVKEEDIESLSMKDKLKRLAEEEKRNKKKTFQVDSCYTGFGKVWEDYDCMLNQTNIGHNNNKFYVIQLIESNGTYSTWNRWGRVGESGQNSRKNFGDLAAAEKDFKKKFKDKTKNNWDDRENFTPAKGKYTLIEMDGQDEADAAANEAANEAIMEKLNSLDKSDASSSLSTAKIRACTLDTPTQSLIELIFNNDMFKEQMAKLNFDVKKMPLGKLNKSQIAKGFEVLEEIENAIRQNKRTEELTSRFYTLIPHSFGRMRPPLISDQSTVQAKFDMLCILGDIEIAQSLQVQVKKEEVEEVDHPLDVNYGLLNCQLKHIDHKDDMFKLISEYTTNTKSWGNLQLLDVWEVAREGADTRFAEHDAIDHRKLLWHGTNVAVVVAILKSGLRIMPHAGGRVGRGLYFASENGKSAAYVGSSSDGTGIMFLNEVALGKQHIITRDDPSLRKAPDGFDSVLAKGTQEPEVKDETMIKLEGKDVIVPKGKPVPAANLSSSFYQSEYLVYKESQCYIRYMLKFKMR